jgi:membrane-associated phospholipid phosphatase
MSIRRLHKKARFVVAPAVMWAAYAVLLTAFALLRAAGDDVLPAHRFDPLESAIFGRAPTRWLQAEIYTRDIAWFDFLMDLLHLVWFFVPLGFGIVVTLFERRRLMEYMGWIVVACYASTFIFLMVPVAPPWMEPGVTRVLAERRVTGYTGLDNNPFAAFPSLHAALPLVIGLFFLLRCDRVRWLGWLAVGYALAVGFAVVYLGEHWVLDVLGGYAFAVGVAAMFISPRVRSGCARIRGDPLGRLAALNDVLSRHPDDAQSESIPLPEQWAA